MISGDTALGRLTDPSDVAAMVGYLASEHARNVTARDTDVEAGTVWCWIGFRVLCLALAAGTKVYAVPHVIR